MNNKHVLVLHVPEVLRHGERGQGDAQADARRLVHLAVDQGGLVDDAGLLHLEPHVGALARALAHAGEDRDPAVLLGHAVDHLLDDDGLADAGPAEEADLASLHVGLQQVDHLDPGLEHLGPGLQLIERRGRAVDLPALLDPVDLVGVERLAQHVEDVAEHRVADRDRDAATEVADRRAAHQPVRLLHADAADAPVADLLRHLGRHGVRGAVELDVELDLEVDLGQGVRWELDVDHRPRDGDDTPFLEHPSRGVTRLCDGGHAVKLPSNGGAPRLRRRSP